MKKALMIKLAGLGDIIMSLPYIYALKKRYPNLEMDWLCSTEAVELLESTRLVNRIYTIRSDRLLYGASHQKAGEVIKAWRAIGGKKYDRIMLAHADRRYKMLALFSRGSEYNLFTKDHRGFSEPSYHGAHYFQLQRYEDGLDSRNIQFPPIYAQLPQEIVDQLKSPYVVLNVGGRDVKPITKQNRICSKGFIERLATQLMALGFQVVLIGNERVDLKLNGDGVVNLTEQLRFVDLAPLMSSSAAVISHDSGPMHMALLAKARLIALFGPTNPSQFLPARDSFNHPIRVFWGGESLPCRPCYSGKTFPFCSDKKCMNSIQLDPIVDQIVSWNHE